MKKSIISCVLVSVFLSMNSQTPALQKCFEDEFNNGMDLTKWDRSDWRFIDACHCLYTDPCYQLSANGCNTFVGYRTLNLENVAFNNVTGTGELSLIAKAEQITIPQIHDICNNLTPVSHTYNYTVPSYFTSLKKFKYGYFQIKSKIPEVTGKDNFGIGANFWLFANGLTPGYYSEIDVVEFVGQNFVSRNGNTHTCNSHYQDLTLPGRDSDNNTNRKKIIFNNAYHTFGVAWFPDRYEYYIDGSMYYSATKNASKFFPMNIILDINVFTGGEIADANTILPYEYKVDNINSYQYQNLATTYCNMADFIPTVYKSLNIGGVSCNPKLNNNRSITIRATDGILFDKGFQADLGSSFTGEIVPLPAYICQ
jgi:beta-glucanase (GH16 family)